MKYFSNNESILKALIHRAPSSRNTLFSILVALAISTNSYSAPVLLSDTELDAISAGTIELTLTSNAAAAGADVVAIALTNVDVHSSKPRRNGTVRTVGNGNALALAFGDMVYTETGYNLETDEQILSLRVVHRIEDVNGNVTVTRYNVDRNGNVRITTRTRQRNRRHRNGNRRPQTETLRVRVVTRGNINS